MCMTFLKPKGVTAVGKGSHLRVRKYLKSEFLKTVCALYVP